jgi:anti-sigma regulatory factor (Ser/Thr protein kinase)
MGGMPVVEPGIELTVAADRTAACEARHAVAGCGLVAAEQEPTLLLLVSELVSNSVRHAGLDAAEHIRVRARCDAACAYVEVCDAGRSGQVPQKRDKHADLLEPGGLGLVLVDEMADRWGVHRHPDQTCVWFELACAA